MKIMLLANNDIGLYKFRKDLIEELLKQHEVVIGLPYGGFVNQLKEVGCRFIDIPVDRRGINPFKDLKLFFLYKKILKQEKPDLVITYTIKPNIYGGYACRILKIPYAVNITGLGSAFENGGILKKIVTVMNRMGCKKAKIVFFENDGNRQLFIQEKIVEEERTHKLNGAGINLQKYQVAPYPEGEKIKFLFMGRIMAEKGIEELFEAMQRLIAEHVDCELHLLGFYEENYKDTINHFEKEGWLHYYGYQEDVRPFIEACHCFVLPSWHEGMANTNLECAATGRPVITSNIHGCLEAVEDGKSGYLCDKQNADALYQAMKHFVKLSYEERRNMGLAGRKRMEEMFDKKQVVEETVKGLGL